MSEAFRGQLFADLKQAVNAWIVDADKVSRAGLSAGALPNKETVRAALQQVFIHQLKTGSLFSLGRRTPSSAERLWKFVCSAGLDEPHDIFVDGSDGDAVTPMTSVEAAGLTFVDRANRFITRVMDDPALFAAGRFAFFIDVSPPDRASCGCF